MQSTGILVTRDQAIECEERVTLLLHPTGFETLATRIWPAIEGYYLARAGIASLVLVGLSAALTWLLVLRRSDALR